MSILCPNCGSIVPDVGCTCELPKASDGVICCYSCLADHESEILLNKQSTTKVPDNYTGNFALVTDTNPT